MLILNTKTRQTKPKVMKKTVLLSVALCGATVMSAQSGEITSNRGENWLSESGDWGLTIDANPLLNYAGNLFNGTQNNNIGGGFWWPNSGLAIQGKKLIDSETAYRGMVRLGFGSNKSTVMVPDLDPASDPAAMVEDVTKNSTMNITLGAGLEKRVGSTRIVGTYGGMFMVMLGSEKETYEYGNPANANNPVVGRVTEMKEGSTFGLGLQAFAGVEWFCAPKVSLSGEYTWGVSLSSTGFSETTAESWDGSGVVTETVEGGTKQNSFGLDTGISGANIGLNFYFQ
jgi:hypothetical protein